MPLTWGKDFLLRIVFQLRVPSSGPWRQVWDAANMLWLLFFPCKIESSLIYSTNFNYVILKAFELEVRNGPSPVSSFPSSGRVQEQMVTWEIVYQRGASQVWLEHRGRRHCSDTHCSPLPGLRGVRLCKATQHLCAHVSC